MTPSYRKRTLLLILLVLLPVGGLSFLSYRVFKDEQARLAEQMQKVAQARLQSVDEYILARLSDLGKSISRRLSETEMKAGSLRLLTQKEPLIQQIMVLTGRSRIHPPQDEPLSQSEAVFVDRMEPLLGDLVKPLVEDGPPFGTTSKLASPSQKSAIFQQGSSDSGFYASFWKQGLDLIYWHKDSTGLLFIVELDRSALMADLMEHLPPQSDFQKGSTALTNESGELIYRLGEYKPQAQEKAKMVVSLSYPFSTWKLSYFQANDFAPKGILQKTNLSLFFSLGALTLTLLGLAIYLHREQSRILLDARQRVNFVNQVSHELKTPLTNIRMYAELLEPLLEEREEKAKQHLRIITEESERLSRLIQNVLIFSKKDRGLSLRREWSSLILLIKQTLDEFDPMFKKKGIQAHLSYELLPEVFLDKDMIKQVLVNLLSNVEKYAASGKEVHVSLSQRGASAVIKIADHGPGIPTKYREHIFSPFFRMSDSLTEGVSGTGIGLTLARELVRLHQGELRLVDSEQGACFEIELPLSPRDQTATSKHSSPPSKNPHLERPKF